MNKKINKNTKLVYEEKKYLLKVAEKVKESGIFI